MYLDLRIQCLFLIQKYLKKKKCYSCRVFKFFHILFKIITIIIILIKFSLILESKTNIARKTGTLLQGC